MKTGFAAASAGAATAAGATAGNSVACDNTGALVAGAFSAGTFTAGALVAGAVVACGRAGVLVGVVLCAGEPHAASTAAAVSATSINGIRLFFIIMYLHLPPSQSAQSKHDNDRCYLLQFDKFTSSQPELARGTSRSEMMPWHAPAAPCYPLISASRCALKEES